MLRVRVTADELDQIDAARGIASRSAYVRSIVARFVGGQEAARLIQIPGDIGEHQQDHGMTLITTPEDACDHQWVKHTSLMAICTVCKETTGRNRVGL